MTAPEVRAEPALPSRKKKMLLDGFFILTVGHLAIGQWRNIKDRAKDKRRDLSYGTDLAKILEKSDFTSLFLANTFRPYDMQGRAFLGAAFLLTIVWSFSYSGRPNQLTGREASGR